MIIPLHILSNLLFSHPINWCYTVKLLIVPLHKLQTNKQSATEQELLLVSNHRLCLQQLKRDMTQTTLAHISSKNIYYVTSTYSAYVAWRIPKSEVRLTNPCGCTTFTQIDGKFPSTPLQLTYLQPLHICMCNDIHMSAHHTPSIR